MNDEHMTYSPLGNGSGKSAASSRGETYGQICITLPFMARNSRKVSAKKKS
jgi:hypothetical protein